MKIRKKNKDLKILIIGLPKSGSSILTYRIAGGNSSLKIFFEPGSRKSLNDLALHQKICSTNKNLITKSLYYWNEKNQLKGISELYDKIIWLKRDPRDVIISQYLYRWNKSHNLEEGAFLKTIEDLKRKEEDPFSLDFKNMLRTNGTRNLLNIMYEQGKRYTTYITERRSLGDRAFDFKYEEMIKGEYKKLEAFLGFRIAGDAEVPDKLSRVRRSKSAENWRNWYTSLDCRFFRHVYYEYLLKLGYDPEDWALNPSPIIKPEEASEYVEKIFRTGKNE